MKSRILIFYLVFFAALSLLLGRLFWLSIIHGEASRTKAEEQRVKIRRIVAPRGVIYDRLNRPLVQSLPVYKICLEREKTCQEISRDQALQLKADNQDADLVVEVGRDYPHGRALAHVLGYLGEVNQEEVESGWPLGSLRGRTGVEESYEDHLRGVDGGEIIEVGANGEVIRIIGRKEPVVGKELKLSIDLDLQLAAYQALEERGEKAALVASTPEGEILALVSYPSFDPNLLTKADLDNPDQPFFNRVISGTYPPGSTFKIVTAVAGLEEGKIDAQTEIEDKGEIVIGQYRYANWYFTQYGKTEGMIGLVRAIKRSTDTFFYKVGEYVGASRIVAWAKSFGFGKVSEIDIGGETTGFLPDPQAGDWFLGNTYHLAIGQGSLGVTPLQLNNMTAVIASEGKLCKPVIANFSREAGSAIGESSRRDTSDGGSERLLRGGVECQDLALQLETLRLIQEGMKEACSSGGTAFPFFTFEPRVACKTGTAEFGDPQDRTHAWLTAYAPVDEPEIVITALVEAGGEGSYIAAPIVKEVMEEWFNKD
jgi:penicillin-binding protein 2